jgi:ribosomal protein S18 acetylase RimI-like enzyme
VASVVFRSMEPSGTASINQAAGLVSLDVEESYRQRGLAVFLVSEAFRQFMRQGILHVEVQAPATNAAAVGLFKKLGFQQTAEGVVWRK